MKGTERFFAIWLLLFFLGNGPTSMAQDSVDKSPVDPQQVITDLVSDNETKSRNAALLIKNSADPKWLPRLSPLLESPQGRSRQIVTMLVLGVFPQKAPAFFSEAAKSSSVHAREAAMYGLARIPAQTVIDPIFAGTKDESETVRSAALRGLQLICRPNGSQLFAALQNGSDTKLPEPHPAQTSLQKRLVESPISENHRQWKGIWHDLASRETILSTQTRYGSVLEDKDAAAVLKKVFAVNNSWAAKPSLPQPLIYDFSMVNLVAGSSKEIHIDASPEEITQTRYLGYDLDRAIQLRLVLDLWLQAPHLYTRNLTLSAEKLTVEVDLEGSPGLHAGVGLLNISYWQSRVASGSSAILTFDRNSGIWLGESVKDTLGTVVWTANAVEGSESAGSLPREIVVQMPEGQVGAQRYNLEFRAEFSTTEGALLLNRATMHEKQKDDSGALLPQLRALAELKLSANSSLDR